MLSDVTFTAKMADLTASLATRDGTWQEVKIRNTTYYRLLCELNEADFIEACDRILWQDEWFPAIARIRAVAAECAAERHRRHRSVTIAPPLVCPYCHGARWVRLGGYDQSGMQAGDEGSRVQPCPKCTTNGRPDYGKEFRLIRDEGGVPNENATKDVDRSRTTWRVPRTAAGRVDMNAIYRESRLLRNLDPNVDGRPQGTGSWQTVADVLLPVSEPEMVPAGAAWSVDDVPFD